MEADLWYVLRMFFRAVLAMGAFIACMWNWWHEDYPKATFYGVLFLMFAPPERVPDLP